MSERKPDLDIVAQLRWHADARTDHHDMNPPLLHEAADEIERLCKWIQEECVPRTDYDCLHDKFDSAAAEINVLRARLDEWEDARKAVADNRPDEVHCGCCAILRKELADERRERNNFWRDRAQRRDADREDLKAAHAAQVAALQEVNAATIRERDEARQEVCGIMHLTRFLAGDYAKERGWDCVRHHFDMPLEAVRFGQTLDSIHETKQNQIETLRAEIRILTEERDDARQDICIAESKGLVGASPQDVAAWNEWGCFSSERTTRVTRTGLFVREVQALTRERDEARTLALKVWMNAKWWDHCQSDDIIKMDALSKRFAETFGTSVHVSDDVPEPVFTVRSSILV